MRFPINRRHFFGVFAGLLSWLPWRRAVAKVVFGFDSFDKLKPAGVDYQWCVKTVVGSPHLGDIDLARMIDAGWHPVPSHRYAAQFHISGEHIEYGGCMLMERSSAVGVVARGKEIDAALRMPEEFAQMCRANGFEMTYRTGATTFDDVYAAGQHRTDETEIAALKAKYPRLEPSDDPKWKGWEETQS